jgi:hypothetical protein
VCLLLIQDVSRYFPIASATLWLIFFVFDGPRLCRITVFAANHLAAKEWD